MFEPSRCPICSKVVGVSEFKIHLGNELLKNQDKIFGLLMFTMAENPEGFLRQFPGSRQFIADMTEMIARVLHEVDSSEESLPTETSH